MPDRSHTSPDPDRLPTPSPDAAAHSAQLVDHLRQRIGEAGGALPFDRYMEAALYAPGLGYYSAGARKFGAAGDFVTAPEVSALFGACVARQCREALVRLGGGAILEFGPGSGVLAADVLTTLDALGCPPERYYLLEVSADLRARQRATLAERVPHWLDRVEWLDRLPETPIRGVVLANEVLDALPVHRFRIAEGGLEEAAVAWEADRFAWRWQAASPELDRTVRARLGDHPAALPLGYTSDINLRVAPWLTALADALAAGLVLCADYGYPRREYYLPERHGGTLMCHYRHRAHGDPFVWPGLQDITAFVDFTAVAEAALAAGLTVAGYTTQAHFLLGAGLTEAMADAAPADTVAQLKLAQQAKTLTLPGEMGERFKFIALTRDLDPPLQGFGFRDLRDAL